LLLQRQLRHQPFQLCILPFQFLETLGLVQLQSAEFLPPAVVGLCGDFSFFTGLRSGFPVRDLDFNLPQRFGLEYVAEDGSRKQPVMVHRALYGSVERFFGVLIEHYAGAFPVWLSPVQAAMIPISERHAEYANKVADQLKAIGVRVTVDARNEKMNAKIREHAMQKVPFLLVVGDKEAEAGKVNVRTRGKEKTEDMLTAEFVEKIRKLIAEKSPGL